MSILPKPLPLKETLQLTNEMISMCRRETNSMSSRRPLIALPSNEYEILSDLRLSFVKGLLTNRTDRVTTSTINSRSPPRRLLETWQIERPTMFAKPRVPTVPRTSLLS